MNNARDLLDERDRALLKQRWREWKRAHRVEVVHSDRTVRMAIEALCNEHGYSLEDIGVFLGVTGERVRQWAKKGGWRLTRQAQLRVWDDVANRFVCVPSFVDYKGAVRRAVRRAARRSDPRHTLCGGDVPAKRRRIAMWVIRDMAEGGRVPGLADIAEAFRLTAPRLTSLLRLRPDTGTQLDNLWRKAGYERPRFSSYKRNRDIGGAAS